MDEIDERIVARVGEDTATETEMVLMCRAVNHLLERVALLEARDVVDNV